MATENNIKTFTAADIEKYHKGLLTSKQMNEMEKAALEDPFLADALEGYAVPGVNAAADMAELQKRLAGRTDNAKVVPIYAVKRKPVGWWRVAAAVVLVGGAAVLASQFLSRKEKQGEMAAVTTSKEGSNDSAGVRVSDGPVTANDDQARPNTSAAAEAKGDERAKGTITATDNRADTDGDGMRDAMDEKVAAAETMVDAEKTKPGLVAPAPVTIEAKSADKYEAEKEEQKKELAKVDDAKQKDVSAAGADVGYTSRKVVASAPAKKNEDIADRNRNQPQTNIFRGRITDGSNRGLPFAKVYNPADNNAGTYTDANGFFTLTYPDTTLTVQVKAIGFENANTELLTNRPSNRVVMQDDRSLSEVVVSRQMPNVASRSANNQVSRKLEEPEPADGWAKYDAYLANNLEAPDELTVTERNKGSVQISFEVDKNGEPINITVEKSLCPKCDQEAIRLVKEGPKWKRSANKHGRTTVTINF